MQLAPLLTVARVPLSVALTQSIRLARPLAGPALDLYAAVQPPGDKNLLSRPEFKAMFLDDLLNGSRFQTSAPINDLILFTRHWGFELRRRRRCRCAGGTATTTTSCRSGTAGTSSTGSRTPGCRSIDGESHLGGLGIAEEVLASLMELGPRRTAPTRARTR